MLNVTLYYNDVTLDNERMRSPSVDPLTGASYLGTVNGQHHTKEFKEISVIRPQEATKYLGIVENTRFRTLPITFRYIVIRSIAKPCPTLKRPNLSYPHVKYSVYVARAAISSLFPVFAMLSGARILTIDVEVAASRSNVTMIYRPHRIVHQIFRYSFFGTQSLQQVDSFDASCALTFPNSTSGKEKNLNT